jgi:type II secretory pathway component PulM
MKWLSLANLQHAYARLAPRERFFVALGGSVLAAVLVFLVVYECQSAKNSLRARIAAKQRQLEKVQTLSGTYQELKRQTEALTAKDAGRAPNWLYSTLDGLVTKSVSRDKVSSMAPSSKTIGDQYVEDSVNVQLVGVTLPQAVGLLHEIEQSTTPIHVSRLQMKKRVADPYQLDVAFSVSTIKTAS